jgi:transposase-like protein
MPWKVDPVPEQRTALVHAVRTAGLSAAEAARRYDVSRKTASKWLARHDADPDAPLADRPRRPRRSPARTAEYNIKRINGGVRPGPARPPGRYQSESMSPTEDLRMWGLWGK